MTWTIGQKKEFGTYNANMIFDENGESILMVFGIAQNYMLEELGERDADGLAIARQVVNDHARIAELTAANESMQEDAVQNTYAFGQMLHANKEQAEDIRTLKQALTDIRATTVTLGDSQSAWKAWRKCSDIAGEALK